MTTFIRLTFKNEQPGCLNLCPQQVFYTVTFNEQASLEYTNLIVLHLTALTIVSRRESGMKPGDA